MAHQFIDLNAPSLQGELPKHPADLPHGLIAPPEKVRELIAQEQAKFPPESFTPEAEERLLNQWTLQYYFDYLGHEVTYRSTPQGPEVLAVGDVERLALRRSLGEEAFRKLKSYLP